MVRNRKKLWRRGLSLLLAAGILLPAAGGGVAASAAESSVGGSSWSQDSYISERISNNYSRVSAGYTAPLYTGEDLVVFHSWATTSSEMVAYQSMTADQTLEMSFSVPADGLYAVKFRYQSQDESVLPIEFSMEVDGAYPFYECRNVELPFTWIPDAEPSFDRYGDEIVTVPEKAFQWEEGYFLDSSSRHSEPLLLQLSAGEHSIRLTVESGAFLLERVSLCATEQVAVYTGAQTAAGNQIIEIQAEDFAYTNDSSIHAMTDYDTAVWPYEVKDTLLNVIDGDSFDTAGQSITYTVDVKTAGYYYIAMNYSQPDKTDFPVFMDVRVDGQIPNSAFQAYQVDYSTKYTKHTLQDQEGNYLAVYLEEGQHTLSLTLSLDPITYALETIEEIMSGVNDLALEITKVAGTNADQYRDLQLSNYIPGLEDTLNGYAARLEALEKSALIYVDGKKNVSIMSSLLIAANQLRSLAEEPDEIPYRIAELSSSTNSVNHHLANTIDHLLENSVALDAIYVYQADAKLPKAPGFFKSLWMNIQRFIASFTDRSYSTTNTDAEHLQVWVNRSSQYVQVMQQMIDEYFTPATGIAVDISIMPDQYKLVLANSSGNAPDVATGINYTIPYELAIRGALVDMAQFADFREAAADYEAGFFLTGTIGDKVYAMPETMNFWVLMYRSDILDKLGLEVPNTMDDVIDMLPELQMRGLNFYYPTAGMIAMRNFHGTTPLLVQNGGALYAGVAQDGTTLGSEESVAGFTALTDLFTVYNMPVNIDNFYQHFRNGDLPIGIADYGTYNLLKNAAPELDGSWEIALVPGTMQEDGTVDRSTCGCAESTVIFKSDSEREAMAWEFIKWWSSADVQAEFGQTMQIIYGDEYFWPTANTQALAQLPIESDDMEIFLQFAKNVVDVARVPGTYMLEREMSNAFNSVVVDGDSVQSRLDAAVKTIDREILRKLEEFGFIDSEGNVIEYYYIPDIESVKEILGRTEEGGEPQ